MLPSRVLISISLGATGYIGGDALYEIAKAHPDWDITAQVRNTDKGVKVAVDYPSVKLVYGDLDDGDLIEKETSKADIIYSKSKRYVWLLLTV